VRPTLDAGRCASLIERILSGEQDAYAEIVSAYQDSLRAALGGFARSADELEDFCHKAFVETYFKLKDYDRVRGPFLPWFLTVARNLVLEDLRRRKAEERRLHRYVERSVQDGTPFEEEPQARVALERCLSEFERSDAEMIRARYREGLSCEEIADTLGKTAVATRKALQRLRERLRACVQRRLATSMEL
jgi:RNA polymerase sigma-70 factor, ECF subfamily